MFLDGEKRIILLISDITDSINHKKMQLKQKEDKVGQVLIGQELNKVFAKHS
jgi:hypothetical protein